MNRINEIGDTPKGQYMLGKLSQRYGEPTLNVDNYGKNPMIANYASKNWNGYGIGDDNERAFVLGKSYEEGVHWIDDGNQKKFRERYGLPPMKRQLNKESKYTNMNRKLIRLTESDIHRIIKESVNRILKEVFQDNGEGFPYMIVTYQGEQEVDRQYVNLPRQGLHAYDDEVPFTLGSNQALIELD